jgi:hypothetical protein
MSGKWRPYQTQYTAIVECTKNLWLVVEDKVNAMVGVVPVVAYGCETRSTEYGRSDKWVPLVLEQWALVDAESVPGAMGIIMGRGGEPPDEETIRGLVEE